MSSVCEYSSLVRLLSALTKNASHPDWELAWHHADEARKICETSQKLLKKHVAEHGCSTHEFYAMRGEEFITPEVQAIR